jgi:hypothetical protein
MVRLQENCKTRRRSPHAYRSRSQSSAWPVSSVLIAGRLVIAQVDRIREVSKGGWDGPNRLAVSVYGRRGSTSNCSDDLGYLRRVG